MTLTERIRDRIADIPVYIVDVPTHPGDAYIVLYPSAGTLRLGGYTGSPTRQSDECRVMCVSNDPGGIERLLDHIRSHVTGWTPDPDDPSQGPLIEADTGPILTTRTESATLHSLTIVYRAHRRRKQGTHV